jgi:hypothetical protein
MGVYIGFANWRGVTRYLAVDTFCLHDVSLTHKCGESPCEEQEEQSHHHMAPGMSLPHESSHCLDQQLSMAVFAPHFSLIFSQYTLYLQAGHLPQPHTVRRQST